MKKFFSLVLALVMALSLTTVAWGATTVTTIDELTKAVAAGGDIVLGADMEISTSLRVSTDVNLDLNGHTLVGPHNYNGGSNLYAFIVESGTFTLTDTSAAQTGEIACKYSGIETKGGTFIMNGGKITAADLAMTAAIVNYGGAVIINDGVVNAYDIAITTQAYFTATATTEVAGGEVNLLSSTNNDAVFETGGQYNTGSASVEVTGGDVNSNGAAFAIYDTTTGTAAMEVSGGSFDADVSEYVAAGSRFDAATGEVTAMPATGVGKYDLYDANGDLYKENITVEYVEAYDDEGAGNIEYYKLTYDGVTYTYFVECSRTKAEWYLTLADNLGAYKHLKHVDYVDYVATGKAYTNIGDDCGELDVSAKAKAYVVTDEDGIKTYFVASAAGQKVIKVGNELVAVNEVVGGLVPHVWVVTAYNDKEEPATVKCKNCPATGKLYATKLAAPIGATFDDTQVAGYWVVVNGSAAPSTDKTVTSAETFDAGIAMYVGMSVMAATGSAVVIGKKKD